MRKIEILAFSQVYKQSSTRPFAIVIRENPLGVGELVVHTEYFPEDVDIHRLKPDSYDRSFEGGAYFYSTQYALQNFLGRAKEALITTKSCGGSLFSYPPEFFGGSAMHYGLIADAVRLFMFGSEFSILEDYFSALGINHG